jgi:demethylsterigmatocystin 6-O-methyltransferase
MAITSTSILEYLVSQVEQFAANTDEVARSKLMITLRDLQYSLESPNDTINRFGYYVSNEQI